MCPAAAQTNLPQTERSLSVGELKTLAFTGRFSEKVMFQVALYGTLSLPMLIPQQLN